MNFLPFLVPTPRPIVRAAATVPVMVRPPAAARRASGLVPAAASAWALKAARCLWLVVSPKRGFNNIFAKPLEAVNVSVLEKFEDGAVVTANDLLDKGILSKCEYGVKILGEGSLTKKLTVQASAFSASAKAKIEEAGGKAEVV